MKKFIRDMLDTNEAHAVRSFLNSRPEQRVTKAVWRFIEARADLRADKALRAQQASVRKLRELGAPELAAALVGTVAESAVLACADVHIVLPLAVASRLLPLPVRMAVLLGVAAVDSAIGTLALLKAQDKAASPEPSHDLKTIVVEAPLGGVWGAEVAALMADGYDMVVVYDHATN